MAIQNAQELFITILSSVHAREQRALQLWQEMSKLAQEEDVKEILDTRTHLIRQSIANLEECFRLLGKQPVTPDTRLHDVLVEDFHRELDEIKQPAMKGLYIIYKAREIADIHAAAYTGLIAMAEFMGNLPVSVLLETNLAAKVVFAERAGDLVHEIGSTMISTGMKKAA